MARIFHTEIEFFVMYLQKCKLTILKKKYQKKWENTYLIVKNATTSGAPSGPQTSGLQTNLSAN